jgi:hypothetical protein
MCSTPPLIKQAGKLAKKAPLTKAVIAGVKRTPIVSHVTSEAKRLRRRMTAPPPDTREQTLGM